MRSNLNHSCRPVHNSYIFYAGILQPGAQQRGFGLLRDRDKLRPPAAALLENCIYVIAGGKVRNHAADGTVTEAEFHTGDVIYREPLTHWAENIGNTTIHLELVELKN